MNQSTWREWYTEIAAALHLSESEDQAATDRLSQLLVHASPLEDLKKLMQGKAAVVLGAGPSLEEDVKRMVTEHILGHVSIVCADGATSAFVRFVGIAPDVIVSDLDGDLEDIVYANRKGAMLLVHGHGDNVMSLNRYVPLLRRPLMGTTQVGERPYVYNFGGFTDGDRAAFAAEESGADPIILAGMGFGRYAGPYSKPGLSEPVLASERKLLKLDFARRLLEWLARNGRSNLVNCTRGGEDLKGIARTEWSYLRRMIR